jgi:hypothetical protein
MNRNMKEWINNMYNGSERAIMPLITYPGTQLVQKRVIDIVKDGRAQYECIQAICSAFKSAAAVMVMDLSVEAEAFGSPVQFSEIETPVVSGHIVNDIDEINNLAVPQVGEARTGEYIKAAELASKNIKDRPVEIIQGSYALGAAKMETVLKVMIPAAGPGILSSIVLGIGRAIGETMAVILVCGNAAQIPRSVLDMVRPMTANIALEMSYADPFHESVLFGTGVVLFIFIAAVNIVINVLSGNAAKFKDKPPHYLL